MYILNHNQGKNRILNWVIFILFIIDKSISSVDKLFNKNNIDAINFYDTSTYNDKNNIIAKDIIKNSKENINQNQDFQNIEILVKNNKDIINNK